MESDRAGNTAIIQAKEKNEKYYPEILANGDTLKNYWSEYLLYKYEDAWTANQAKRAAVLFEKYPFLKSDQSNVEL